MKQTFLIYKKNPIVYSDLKFRYSKKILLLLVFFLFSVKVSAQDLPAGITGIGIQQLVNGTIQNLTNAGTTLLGNGSIAIGGASSNLSSLLNQFNTIAQDNISTPIQDLSENIKNLASQLYSVSTRLNSILSQQQSCLLLNSQVVIAGIQTITSEIKNGIPIISNDSPRLNYFQFDGHSPSLVPQNGGRINIIGFKLWPGSIPPSITILDESRENVFMQVSAERGSNNNSISFILDSLKIQQYAGQTLQIKVEPKDKSWLLFTKSLGVFYLPISLPASISTELKIIAHMQYSCEKDTTAILDYRPFNFDNSSCGNRINVSHTETWALPKGGVILSVAYHGAIDLNNDHNISVVPIGASITANGWIDSPTCVNLLFGQILKKNTWWHASIAPVVSFKKDISYVSTSESPFVKMESQTTNILLNLNSTCLNPKAIIFWFDIVQKTGSNIKTIYTSSQSNSITFADDWKGLSINALLNIVPVNNSCQLAVKIMQPLCGL